MEAVTWWAAACFAAALASFRFAISYELQTALDLGRVGPPYFIRLGPEFFSSLWLRLFELLQDVANSREEVVERIGV